MIPLDARGSSKCMCVVVGCVCAFGVRSGGVVFMWVWPHVEVVAMATQFAPCLCSGVTYLWV